MKNFWGRGAQSLLFSACKKNTTTGIFRAGAKVALLLSVAFIAVTAKAQNSFYTPQVLVGDWGSVTNDNSFFTNGPDHNCPNIAGFTPNAPVWYQWTAPQSGVVEMDTIGSVEDIFDVFPLDTAMAVFTSTGSSITTLSQVAANDNLVPINSSSNIRGSSQQASLTQFGESGSADYGSIVGQGNEPVLSYPMPYYGPSHLRFNAVAGTTYYIAVDTEPDVDYATFFPTLPTGLTTLQWAYQSSGVFRFATEDVDYFSDLPLYQTAETESAQLAGNGNADVNSPVLTYYPYNAQGVLVTVTRVAGSSGRCTVDYSTEDGTALTGFPLSQLWLGSSSNDVPAIAGVDYMPVTNTLVFDDYEMSKTILVPIINAGANGSGGNINNTYFGITLTNAQLDPNETGDVSQPRIDPTFSTAIVKILNNTADPYGPDMVPQVTTNTVITPTSTNTVVITNLVQALFPTNVIFNFEKANYRVPEDVSVGGSVSPWTHVAIYVHRSGTNGAAATLGYRINNFMNNDVDAGEEGNIYFPLQPGSDYAEATPANLSAGSTIRGTNSDFDLVNGSIAFPDASAQGGNYQPITFTITNSTLTKFNKDFKIEIYREAKSPFGNNTVPWLPGMVAETTVTILFNDQHPPAGSVDEFYNADFNTLMALPQGLEPQTNPQKDENPGVSGVVNSLVVLTNGEALAAGEFVSYNGLTYPNGNPINNIVLIDANGNLDTSFEPNSGANGAINSVAQTWDGRYIIGGNFTSFNGQQQQYVARLNPDGSVDASFAPALDGNVQSVVIQPDNQILIGGSFNHVNGQPVSGLARLNTDGSLDTSFNSGTTLNGTVNAMSILPGIYSSRISNGSMQEDDNVFNISPNAIGRATIKYTFPFANEMQLVYGGTVIYDTSVVANNRPNQFSVPFGPGTAPLVIVVNPGGNLPTATNWSYTAIIQTNSDVMAAGNFTVNGENYLDLARFTTNGLLDTTFSNIFSGADNSINALAWQYNGEVVIGGAFTHFNGTNLNGLARLNWDGSVDSSFFNGTGANDIVWNLNLQHDGTIYVGGQFTSINGTHRLGFARLNPDGTVDTSFMDTAYNQFAGLKKIFADDFAAVYASAVQNDSNVIIGGYFNQVGGGQATTNICNSLDDEMGIQESFNDPNLWVEPKTRDGVRNRSSIARLVGGSTPGPGNIYLQESAYSANKSQTSLSVGLVRENGTLGPVSANFSIPQGATQSGTAQSGQDYSYDSTPPLFWLASQFTVHASRERSDGLFGVNGSLQDLYGLFLTLADLPINNQSLVTVSVINNSQSSGNLSAQFQLANPSGDNEFYLGGENIPICSALGQSTAPFTIIDNTTQWGTFGFISTNYVATNSTATISVFRSNGNPQGPVTMRCFATNGTAIAGTDYQGVTNLALQFSTFTVLTNYTVNVRASGLISTNFTEKTVNLSLTSIKGGNAIFGISNAVLRLINPSFQGYLTLSATNYSGSEGAGSVSFSVNRVAGSAGQISVGYATTNITARAGVNYVGMTNTLSWNGGDTSPRVITVPLINSGAVGGTEQFGISLFNPTNSLGSAPSLFYAGSPGSVTNATVTITNDDSYGMLQFSQPAYLVAENGGYATLTVIRTGGAVGPASVAFATSDGMNAFAYTNYVPTNGVLSFVSNQISASFTVQILNDNVQDPGNFFFNVTLSSPANAALGTPTNAIVNILDASTYGWSPGSSNGVFNANINGDVFALALQTNAQILVGGNFTAINGAPDDYIGRLNADGSMDSSFASSANGAVQALVCQTDGNIILGGTFSTVDGIIRNNIARLTTSGTLDTTFNPGAGANGPVNTLAETFVGGTREIYVGGDFSEISSGTGNSSGYSPYLGRLNNNGTLDTTFNTGFGLDGPVNAIAVYPTNSIYAGKVLVGGSFIHYNAITVNGLIRLNSDGSVDTGFNAGTAATNGAVNAIAIQPDGRILVGGSFNNFNGVAVNNFTRLNNDGSTDTNFVSAIGSGANNVVDEIVVQPDNRILIVGQFSQVGGLIRNGVTRLLPTGANDLAINFGTGANGVVDAAVIQPSTGFITLGGGFTVYNGQAVGHIVQIYGNSITGSGAFQFSAPSYQVNENGIVVPITILRTGGTSGPNSDGSGNVSVNFSIDTNSSTAVAGVNYRPVPPTTLVFTPGQTFQTVTIPILSTSITTTNSWVVYMNLSSNTPPLPVTTLGSPSSEVPLTIVNTNSAVSFQNPFPIVFETTSVFPANITLVRQGFTNGTSSVEFFTTTNTGSGIPNVDYYPTNEIVTFNAGAAQATAQVLVISNSTLEKTIGLSLTNPANSIIYSPSNAMLSVSSDVSAPGQLYFASTNYVVNASAGTVAVTLLRTNGHLDSVTYGYITVPGTALPNVNYQTTSNTVTFQQNDSSELITIPILTNNPPEAPVNFSIVLTNTTASVASIIDPTNTTVTVVDDVNTGIAFLNVTNSFEETNGVVSVLVSRLGNTNSPISIQYATTDGTAVAGVNYVAASGTLNIDRGQSLGGISITLKNNEDVTNEQFGINLFSPSSGAQLVSPSNAVVVITPAGAGLTFTSPTNSVFKNAGSITIPVVCMNPSAEPVIVDSNTIPLSVNYSTTNGTAIAGQDYIGVSGTLVFSNGIVTNTITVPIINNSLITGLRTFTVGLSAPMPVPPGELVAPTNEVITIIDSNSGLAFSSPNYSIVDGGLALITVVRTDNTNTVSTVDFATGGGTAVPYTDYYPTNGVLTFSNGQTSASFVVSVIANSGVQPDKTILIGLSNPTNGVLTAPNSTTLTILNHNGSYVVPAGVALYSPTNTPTGILQSGQQAMLWFSFRDAGGTNVSDLKATLLNTPAITALNSTSGTTTEDYGPLAVNGPSVAREFTFIPNGTNSQNVLATFQLLDGTKNIGTNSFTLTLGTWSTTFYNTNPITLPPSSNYFASAIATPYPSMITVSNVGGVLVSATVTLTNFTHNSPQSAGILVVSPAQQDTLIMGGVGTVNIGMNNVTLIFSDAATNSLPSTTTTSTPITNGVYKPTQDAAIPDFP